MDRRHDLARHWHCGGAYAATPPEITEITVNEASRNMALRPVRKNTKNPASTMTTLTTMPTFNACCSIFLLRVAIDYFAYGEGERLSFGPVIIYQIAAVAVCLVRRAPQTRRAAP